MNELHRLFGVALIELFMRAGPACGAVPLSEGCRVWWIWIKVAGGCGAWAGAGNLQPRCRRFLLPWVSRKRMSEKMNFQPLSIESVLGPPGSSWRSGCTS